eukprot:Rhum_TRINITY_DN14361_c0_g1::Rhum_TRINITY_DN14361_c0_g1_i1::g.83099::m.83099
MQQRDTIPGMSVKRKQRFGSERREGSRSQGGERRGLGDAVLGVEVLQLVEDRLLLALLARRHLRVHGPRLDRLRRHAGVQELLAEGVVSHVHLQPVRALRERLERRRRRVHGVVADVRHSRQAEVRPVVEHGPAQGASRGVSRVRGSQHLATEVLPLRRRRVEVHRVVVDRRSRERELRAHLHEEAVERVDRLVLNVDLAAVEATAELHQLLVLLGLSPQLVEAGGVDVQLLARVHRVEHVAGLQGVLPLEAERLLELVRRDVELVRLQDRRLRGDRVVVLVDEEVLVDLLARDLALRRHVDAALLELSGDKLAHSLRVGVRLDEDEGVVAGHCCEGWVVTVRQ